VLDPIGGFERIKDFFISYVETAFRISNEETAAGRRELLESDGALATAPFVEPVPRYRQYADPLEKVIDDPRLDHLSQDGREAFVELALSGLFDGKEATGPSSDNRPTTHTSIKSKCSFGDRSQGSPASSRRAPVRARPRASCCLSSPPSRTRRSSGRRRRRVTCRGSGGRAAMRSSTSAATRASGGRRRSGR